MQTNFKKRGFHVVVGAAAVLILGAAAVFGWITTSESVQVSVCDQTTGFNSNVEMTIYNNEVGNLNTQGYIENIAITGGLTAPVFSPNPLPNKTNASDVAASAVGSIDVGSFVGHVTVTYDFVWRSGGPTGQIGDTHHKTVEFDVEACEATTTTTQEVTTTTMEETTTTTVIVTTTTTEESTTTTAEESTTTTAGDTTTTAAEVHLDCTLDAEGNYHKANGEFQAVAECTTVAAAPSAIEAPPAFTG